MHAQAPGFCMEDHLASLSDFDGCGGTMNLLTLATAVAGSLSAAAPSSSMANRISQNRSRYLKSDKSHCMTLMR
jgi:hypothetical protein